MSCMAHLNPTNTAMPHTGRAAWCDIRHKAKYLSVSKSFSGYIAFSFGLLLHLHCQVQVSWEQHAMHEDIAAIKIRVESVQQRGNDKSPAHNRNHTACAEVGDSFSAASLENMPGRQQEKVQSGCELQNCRSKS